MIETLLLALLCVMISMSIAYELDGGLKASHICQQYGDNDMRCYEALRLSK